MSLTQYAKPLSAWFINFVGLIVLAGRHDSLMLENFALRPQLAVYRRGRPKPAIR
jgi:hypothetical protein